MRNSFINELLVLAKSNPKVWLLTGDLGFGVLEPFSKEMPNRYINVGVAEQNMTGMAAGLAHDGRTVFTYSIANFPTFRCLEQIRNDVCYHNADVKVVSVGAGVAYGSHGYTHFGIEDIAIMRALPNMRLICPADPHEARRAAHLAVSTPGPFYIRLGKNGEPNLHPGPVEFKLGEMIELLPAADITLIATGSVAYHAFKASESFTAKGLSVGVYSCPSLVPFDTARFTDICQRSQVIITIEEHGPIGGLGAIVADEYLKLRNLDFGNSVAHCKLERLSLPQLPPGVGNQEYFLSKFGLDSQGIEATIGKYV